MDNNNWRPTPPGGEPNMETPDQQSQRALPETSSTSLDSTAGQSNGGDWQEEVYQKALMDNNNWRPTPPGGEPNMETPDQLMGQSDVMQPGQQQLMSQIQSLPAQLQQQPNALQRDMQQGLQASSQASGSVLQPQNVVDQQKQLYQSQRALPETSSTSLDSTAGQSNGGDWQEEVYQKIKVMKEMYFPELNEMYQKIATKLQQHDSLPQQPKSDQIEKLKILRSMLERIIGFLQVSKINVQPSHKEKLDAYEKQIVNFINLNSLRTHSMQQPPQVQSHEPPSS